MSLPTVETPPSLDGLACRYREVRERTEWLCAPLSAEDQTAQSMPDASPAKWHRAHTTWFFETFVLRPCHAAYRPLDERYAYLFNSYYNALGPQYFRPHRGLVTRPGVAAVTEYRGHVDRAMSDLLAGQAPLAGDVPAAVIELGLNHEEQHQELILTDVKHLLAHNPSWPVYRDGAAAPTGAQTPPLGWQSMAEGIYEIGHTGPAFSFDNETPRHKVFLQGFQLANRLVTVGEFLDFIADGGYRRPELWLSDGWRTVQERAWEAPLYWIQEGGERRAFTLGGLRALDRAEAVAHVSYYEADAYARWAGARLPSEAEWEVVAADRPVAGNLLENGRFHPGSAGGSGGATRLYGDVWVWTQSAYLPYPGFRPAAGAIGEYNAKFMSGQMVLRGGSCATPRGHIRATYRNFFPPDARWQFSGIRLARDAVR
jgi:ergothioneine biosynthesis protein EgtB